MNANERPASMDSKTFVIARRDRRKTVKRSVTAWLLGAAALCALAIILSGCGGGDGGQCQAPPAKTCACDYELELTTAGMNVLCKPCAEIR